jgi:hypothetical protein
MSANDEPVAEAFAQAFSILQPLICAEWPEVDPKALEDTGGDYDQVVALVAKATEHSKTMVKRQLNELQDIATEEPKAEPKTEAESSTEGAIGSAQRKLMDALQVLQDKANELTNYMRKNALADAKTKAEQNPLVTLLIAIGLGFLIGFVIRGLGRGSARRDC